MAELEKANRMVINQLLDHALFTYSVTPNMRQGEQKAHNIYQTPIGRQRINGWFNRLFGQSPVEFRGNWFWQLGPNRIPSDDVRVILATLKAIINSPATQGLESDRVIEAWPVIESVRSVMPELSEKEIGKIIHVWFVERYQLLQPDYPEADVERNTTIDEFWDVAPDFVAVAQLFVAVMKSSLNAETVAKTPIQRVNAYLLKYRFLTTSSSLWPILIENKVEIAELWRPLQRFYLEVGDDYALLLDGSHRQQRSRQYFVALGVARSLGDGLPDADLGVRIRQIAHQLYPRAVVNQTQVKETLINSALATEINDFWVATPITKRFAITLGDDDYE